MLSSFYLWFGHFFYPTLFVFVWSFVYLMFSYYVVLCIRSFRRCALCVREFVCMSFECVRHVCEYYCLNILVYYHSTYNKRKKNTLRKYTKARNEAHHHCYTWFHSKTWSSTLVCVYSFVLTVATDGTELFFLSLSLSLSLQISLSDLLLSKDLL